MKTPISRRDFLQMAAIGTGSVILLPGCIRMQEISHWHCFTSEEAVVLESIIEQIIPTDNWPGAKSAGVAVFIDR